MASSGATNGRVRLSDADQAAITKTSTLTGVFYLYFYTLGDVDGEVASQISMDPAI